MKASSKTLFNLVFISVLLLGWKYIVGVSLEEAVFNSFWGLVAIMAVDYVQFRREEKASPFADLHVESATAIRTLLVVLTRTPG